MGGERPRECGAAWENGYDPNKQSRQLENTGKELVITIDDEGEGLDQDKLAGPARRRKNLPQRKRGGYLPDSRSFLDEAGEGTLSTTAPGTEMKDKHLARSRQRRSPRWDTK